MDWYDYIKAYEICQVPKVVILWKFKLSEFAKYTRVECLKNHIKIYYYKMKKVINDDKFLIHLFYKNLSGDALT
jgi:hypothetical protein